MERVDTGVRLWSLDPEWIRGEVDTFIAGQR
jgi:hypothetical protein